MTVLERGTIGSGGSTQPQGRYLHPTLHKHGKLADFSLTAYEFSVDHHQRKFREGSLEEGIDGALSGYLQLSSDDVLERLATAFDDEDSPLKVVSREVASSIAGIALTQGAQHYPGSGWLYPRAICAELLKHPNITVIEGLGDTTLRQGDEDQWFSIAATGDCVATGDTAVVTTAWEAVDDVRLDWLPLQPIRGQTTLLPSQGALTDLKCTVCHAGYTPPAKVVCIVLALPTGSTKHRRKSAKQITRPTFNNCCQTPLLDSAIGSESPTGQAASVRYG